MDIENIKHFVGMIMEEVEGSSNYKKCAMKWENVLPEASKMFLTMAEQEKHHGSMLLDILKMARAKETDPNKQIILDFVIDISIEQLNK
jgi:rubrerythrin